MLTGKEEAPDPINKNGMGNAESVDMPQYLKGHCKRESGNGVKPPKGKKVFPQFAYGNSMESPSYFRNANSILCRESYDNPYLKTRVKPQNKLETLRSSTLNNYEFYNISEQRFVNPPMTGYKTNKVVNTITNQIQYVRTPTAMIPEMDFERAYKTLSPKMFKKQRELFTDFVEKNDQQNVYGPLNMRDRPVGFREVKNYAYGENELKLKAMRTANLGTNSRNTEKRYAKTTRQVLPRLDAEKYYKKDQRYLNQFHNSIIKECIDTTLKQNNKSVVYNAGYFVGHQNESENDNGLIAAFEKHLEFEKQFTQ